MYNWLLIISITLVSTTMLVFVSAYIAILPETGAYYNHDRSDILMLSNSFNILYLIVTPLIFASLKSHYSLLVYISILFTGIGCIGRYLCFTNYNVALIMSTLVAIGHIPIITAPYGLLDLFPQSQKGYAASIPLFVPTLGINFSILYGMAYIASQFPQTINFNRYDEIDSLNLIIAILGAISCLSSMSCMIKLKKQITKINQDTVQIRDKNVSFFKSIQNEFKGGRFIMVMLVSWGVILGINWTYGGMFGVFLNSTGLTHKDIALIGLFANLSSVFFSNLGTWISNMFSISNSLIIFILNISGFLASLFIQASSTLNSPIFQDKIALIIAIIILRAGFSAFVSLSLIQLSHCGPSVLLSALFFYIANGSNLATIYIVDYFQNSVSLGIMSGIILLCIILVHWAEGKKKIYENVENMQVSTLESSKQKNLTKQSQIQLQSQCKNLKFTKNKSAQKLAGSSPQKFCQQNVKRQQKIH